MAAGTDPVRSGASAQNIHARATSVGALRHETDGLSRGELFIEYLLETHGLHLCWRQSPLPGGRSQGNAGRAGADHEDAVRDEFARLRQARAQYRAGGAGQNDAEKET